MPSNLHRWASDHALKKERNQLYSERTALLILMAGNKEFGESSERQEQFKHYEKRIAQVESALLLGKAFSLGIEYPTKEEKPDWWEWEVVPAESWLSEKGQIALNKLIRDERRRNVEWWVKVITPLLGSLISLLGLLIALITILHTLGRI